MAYSILSVEPASLTSPYTTISLCSHPVCSLSWLAFRMSGNLFYSDINSNVTVQRGLAEEPVTLGTLYP